MADNVEIKFTGDNSSLKKSISELEKKLGTLDKKSQKTEKSTSGIFSRIGGSVSAILPAVSVAAIVGGFAAITNAVDELNNSARMIGVSVETLSKFQNGLSSFGVDSGKVVDAMKEISKRSAEAAQAGSGAFFDILNKAGIDVKAFSQKSADEQVKIYSSVIKEFGTSAGEAKRLADIAGGESGVAFFDAFAKGGQSAVSAAVGVSNETAAAFAGLAGEFDVTFKEIKINITNSLAPIASFATESIQAMKEIASIISDVVAVQIANLGNNFEILKLNTLNVWSAIKVGGLAAADVITTAFNSMLSIVSDSLNVVINNINGLTGALSKIGVSIAKIPPIDININGAVNTINKLIGKELELVGTRKSAVDQLNKMNKASENGVSGREANTAATKDLTKANNDLKKSVEGVNSIVGEQNKQLSDAEKRMNNLTSIAKGAANEMQGNFENFFFNAMQGDFGNLEQDFVKTIDKMVSKALAADLANALGFGSNSKDGGIFGSILGSSSGGGSGGGILSSIGGLFGGGGSGGGILGSIGGLFGGGSGGGILSSIGGLFGGGFANGGSVVGGGQFLVGENGPELFTPKQSGTISPNGGGKNINVSMTVVAKDADSFKQNQRQIVAGLAQSISSAGQRDL